MDQEYLSTGGAPMDSKGHTFSEDVWSARLCGCLAVSAERV